MAASLCIQQFFCVFLFALLNLSSLKAEKKSLLQCNSSAPGLFGDLRHDIDGCFLPGVDSPENKMKQNLPPIMSRMKPAIPQPSSPPKLAVKPQWLEEVSDHLLSSTNLVNNFNQEENSAVHHSTDCEGSACATSLLPSPQCCRSETRLLYPLYGRSLTSGRLVRIAQELDPNGIQQPVVYRHCLNEKSELVRGRCHQSTLPRLFFVPSTGGYPYRQDLILVPSNCECLVHLGHASDKDNQEGENDTEHKTTIVVSTTLLPLVEGSGTGVGVGSGLDSTLQEDGLFRPNI